MPYKDPAMQRAWNAAYCQKRPSRRGDPRYRAQTLASQIKAREATRRFAREYKVERGCLDCGINDFRVLDFDHRDGSQKRFDISRAISSRMFSLTRIKEEIEKCDVRCANCHRIKTFERTWAMGRSLGFHPGEAGSSPVVRAMQV